MLSSSEFNSAVPQFTNGNYANNPLDPSFVEEPSMSDYNRGVEPLETLPAQWWNWLCNQFTSRFNKLNLYVKNIFDELTQLFSLVNVTPDGTEGSVTTGQLKNIFKELYPTYVSDKLELGTTYVPQTREVNGHALTGNVTVTKSDVGLGNVENTGDSAVPVSGGTTKFTTGGAYTELNKKADKAVSATNDDVATLDANGNLKDSGVPLTSLPSANNSKNAQYFLSKANRTGTTYWSIEVRHKTASFLSGILTIIDRKGSEYKIALGGSDTVLVPTIYRMSNISRAGFGAILAFAYDATTIARDYCKIFVKSDAWDWDNICYVSAYEDGDVITVQSDNERTTDGTDFNSATPLSMKDFATTDITSAKADLADLAPAFSTSTAYTVGDYVTFGGTLYRCTVAHSAGAWNNSHFTTVTVGGDLETKANQTDLAVPSDAVLHYSFDDVPDYPDGSADVRLLNNNTYNIQSTGYNFISDNGGTLANSNGNMLITGSGTNSGARIAGDNLLNKLIKISINITEVTGDVRIGSYSTTSYILDKTGRYDIVLLYDYTGKYNNLYFHTNGTFTAIIEKIYIGDGSYATPIIDNTSGQWNSISASGVAVKGVNGKGLKCFKNVVNGGAFNLSENFSISLWINPENSTVGLKGDIINKPSQFILRNGAGFGNYLMIYIYINDIENFKSPGALLTANQWTHLVVTKNGTALTVFKDAVKTNEYTLPAGELHKNNTDFNIGNVSNTRPQSIDDLLIFDRALSADEVQALYLNKANTPKFYDINNYNIDNATPIPEQNSNKLFTTGGAFDFFGGNTNSKTWLTKLFSRTIGNSWTDSLDLTTSGTQFASAYGKGVWVVVSQRGTFWSENLTSWTAITGVGAEGSSINFKDGVFVLGTRNAGVWWSENGKSFTLATGISGSLSVTTTHVGEIWLASTNTNAWWSNDGKSWTTCVGTSNGINIGAIDYGSGKYFAGKKNEGLITSNDGKTWSSVSDSIFNDYTMAVKYTNGIWLIGTYRHNYNKNLITSKDDGSTWYEENITVNGYVSDIWTVGNNAIVTWSGINSQTQIITLGINEENSCIIHHESIDYTISTFIEIFGTYFAFTFPGQLMRSTNLLVWENTFAEAKSSSLNTFIFAENKLLYTSQLDGAQFSEIDLNAV